MNIPIQTNPRVRNRTLAAGLALILGTILGSPSLPIANADTLSLGGDIYFSDDRAIFDAGSSRNAFVTGFTASINGEVLGDAHLTGFSTSLKAPVRGDLYVTGANIEIDANTGGDLSAAGFTIKMSSSAAVVGNARLVGADVDIQAPIKGALLATAATLNLDGTVAGDAKLTAADITFGSNASIAGLLTYSAPKQISIPESVAPASRVRFVPRSSANVLSDIGDTVSSPIQNYWPRLASSAVAAVLSLGFLLVLAAVLLAFSPRLIESVRVRASEHAWYALIFGFIGLSILFGAVPVSLMTLVGIPLALVALLLIFVFWTLGYLLGIYVLGTHVWIAFGGTVDRLSVKLLVIAVGVVIAAALNFIPIVGWLLNLGILLFGLGAIAIVLLDALLKRTRETEDLHEQEKSLEGEKYAV